MTIDKENPRGLGVGFDKSQESGLTPLNVILNRLDGIRKSGKGYICKCPAHADRSPSLSISEVADGRILLKCWAGCSALSVVQALGLELSDLFPKRISADMTPQERTQARQSAKITGVLAALGVLAFEIEIILIGGFASIAGTVTVPDLERMVLAVNRIQDIKAVLRDR